MRAPSRGSDRGRRPARDVAPSVRVVQRRASAGVARSETVRAFDGARERSPGPVIPPPHARGAVRVVRPVPGAVPATRRVPAGGRGGPAVPGAVLGGRAVPGAARRGGGAPRRELAQVPPVVPGTARVPVRVVPPAGAMRPGAMAGIAAGRGRRAAIPRCGPRSAGAGRRPSGCPSSPPRPAGYPPPRLRPRVRTRRTGAGTRCRSRPPFGR